MSVQGTMELDGAPGEDFLLQPTGQSGSSPCYGYGGYSDITPRASLTVTDKHGTTLAIGHLGRGAYVNNSGACIFDFQVRVPDHQDFYGIEVTHRGIVEFTYAEMKQGPGISLGN
jgi:hypothetical protein